MTHHHDLIHRMAAELDHYRQLVTDDRREVHPLAAEARAVLAASVTSPPDWRGLCEELLALVERCPVTSDTDWIADRNELIVRSHAAKRNALAQPEPEVVGPTDEELLRMAAEAIDPYDKIGIGEYEAETECAVHAYGSELIAFARAVLARWGRPAPAPTGERQAAPVPALPEDAQVIEPAKHTILVPASVAKDHAACPIAAALRAAADRTEADSIWHGCQEHTGVRWAVHQLRGIAAELEGHHA